jgi:hypothetical protein
MWISGQVITLSIQVHKKILDSEGRVERFMRKYGIENQTE